MKDELYLINILESISFLKSYMESKNAEDLEKSTLLRDAVCKRIEDIGENIKKISAKMKKNYKKIDWIAFVETRNFLTHVYQKVNIQKLWIILNRDIPILEKKIKEILKRN